MKPELKDNYYQLFPEIEPFNSGYLKVSDRHEIYYEEVGNPEGPPLVLLHGGPGGGISTASRQFCDPDFYRLILFDQRGAGKSKPHAELENNTTWELVADIEKLRKHLKIERWLVVGGSWGSTLALVYAIKHTEVVKGLILRGIFLGRHEDVHWLFQEGASALFPEEWEHFLAPIPPQEHKDLLSAYHSRLIGSDEEKKLECAIAWSQWEAAISKLIPDPKYKEDFNDPQAALPFARIETHYFMNRCFLPSDNYILEEAHKLRELPCAIVHGRYDIVCLVKSAWELHQTLPQATLNIIPDAGHSSRENGTRHALIQAAEDFKKL